MEEYRGVRKSFWDLAEDQKENIVQLAKIEATMEQRWSLEGENEKEEDRDEKRRV